MTPLSLESQLLCNFQNCKKYAQKSHLRYKLVQFSQVLMKCYSTNDSLDLFFHSVTSFPHSWLQFSDIFSQMPQPMKSL